MPHGWGNGKSNRVTIDSATKLAVLMRDHWLCQVKWDINCTINATEVDHIIRVVDGGSDQMNNLRGSCSGCNARRNYGTRRLGNRQSRPVKRNPGLVN